MALYAIGDLHLSLTADKPMEVFGPAWENYTERIGDALSRLTAGDVLVLAGDTSWGIDLNEAEADFRFLETTPCAGPGDGSLRRTRSPTTPRSSTGRWEDWRLP